MNCFMVWWQFKVEIKSFRIWHILIYNKLAIKSKVQEPQNLKVKPCNWDRDRTLLTVQLVSECLSTQATRLNVQGMDALTLQ